MKNYFLVTSLLFAVLYTVCSADTFKHKSKDIVYHGYAKQELVNGKNIIVTPENETLELNLAEYDVENNSTGRNNFVSLLSITDGIELDFETKIFEESIVEEADKGPLFILIEIDTPGGNIGLCKRLCAAITNLRYCQTFIYIKGGKNGGAFSAGAAVSLACNKIYMAPATSIGAATSIIIGSDGHISDMKETFGETVGEKFNSAWRSYFASLAQEHNRSGAIAKAMVDKDISVVEVDRGGKRLFVESKDQRPDDISVRTLCKRGELLTLSATEALSCHVADAVVESRQAMLIEAGFPNAPVIECEKLVQAKEEFEKVVRKFKKLNERLDLKFKELEAQYANHSLTQSQALRSYEAIIKNAEYLLKLKRSYSDIPYEEEDLISAINSLKARYTAIKSMR